MNFDLLPHELIIDNFAGGGGTTLALNKLLIVLWMLPSTMIQKRLQCIE